jgi:hypothetical protein
MDINAIRDALHKQPFQPFDLCLADGRRVAVNHPEFVAMTKRVVVVLDEDSYSTTIEPLLIVTLEPRRSSKNGGNGAHKRKPKN